MMNDEIKPQQTQSGLCFFHLKSCKLVVVQQQTDIIICFVGEKVGIPLDGFRSWNG